MGLLPNNKFRVRAEIRLATQTESQGWSSDREATDKRHIMSYGNWKNELNQERT